MIGLIDQLLYEKESPYSAYASLFWREAPFGLKGFAFDLLIDESHQMQFSLSDHAVENGTTISDHVESRLRSVTVTGLFTNHPVSGKSYIEDTADGWEFTEEVDIESDDLAAVTNRSLTKWQKLQSLASLREPVTLYTALETYPDMVITDLRATRGPQDGEAVKFTMTLREAKSVALSGRTVNATRDTGTEAGRATANKENRGAQSTKAREISEDIAPVTGGGFY